MVNWETGKPTGNQPKASGKGRGEMTNQHKIIAAIIIGVLAVAGVSAFNNSSSPTVSSDKQVASVSTANTNPSGANASAETNSYAYISDFKTGYSDGYSEGVSGYAYPDQSLLANSTRGYTDGFSQGYNDGQSQQAALANKLCSQASVSMGGEGVRPQSYSSGGGSSSGSAPSSGVLGAREEKVDNGLSTNMRRALLIGGGAAAGAGLGGAFGGKKGALIGALAGGGTGTALAFTKKPQRAFNRKVSKKDVLVKSLIGAGAGAGIGALAGGKRGALSGAALGGGGGLIWSLLSGKRNRR
jgi:hypothetical protein